MIHLLRHRLLAVLTVLAVLGGLAHQVHERFATHHHCAETDECCDSHDGSESPAPDHHGKPCDHALCSHSIVALVESPAPTLTRTWINGARIPERFTQPPEVDPVDIDHPPQLG